MSMQLFVTNCKQGLQLVADAGFCIGVWKHRCVRIYLRRVFGNRGLGSHQTQPTLNGFPSGPQSPFARVGSNHRPNRSHPKGLVLPREPLLAEILPLNVQRPESCALPALRRNCQAPRISAASACRSALQRDQAAMFISYCVRGTSFQIVAHITASRACTNASHESTAAFASSNESSNLVAAS